MVSMVVVLAAACGGAQKTPIAPLPEDPKPEATTPAPAPAPAAAAEPAAPPAPLPPVEIRLATGETKVKILSGGKGKKQKVRYTAKQGAKQTIEVAMDFAGKQDANEEIVPTIVLIGEAETRTVDKDGTADYTLTVTGTDARAPAGTNVPTDNVKNVLEAISGLTVEGKLGGTGLVGDTTLRIAQPQPNSARALELIRLTFPTLPVLPAEPIGVGAKWQSTTTTKLADQIDVTQVTDYELVSQADATWKIKGTTKVTGKDQSIDTSKISSITGTGSSETTIAAGVLYPTYTSSLETKFQASENNQSAQFAIKIGGAVTPK